MRSFPWNRYALAALVMAVAACSDAPSGPSPSNVPDVAALLAEMSAPSVAAARGLAGGDLSFNVIRMPGTDNAVCTYSASSGYFECPNIVTSGLTITRKYRLLDAAGNAQSQADANTSAIETRGTVDGTLSSTFGGAVPSTSTSEVHGASADTLSGVGTDTHTLHGVSTMTVKGSVQAGSTVFPIEDSEKMTIANVVLPNAKKGQKWPQSGSIIVDESSDASDPLLANSSHVVISFDGTSVVTMTMTSHFSTFTCRFDLAAPAISRGSCVP
ncbi:MAG: hypothetical protein ACJ796_19805 [Gemmatimonadaceae bacterium]